ncbi:hypothetical protein DL769_009140 [Monosporascus sp. CRB-8-3]|nr:hypothetical protein DL769_009140 [Monosporascus sp. CRB-8-3]
MDQTYRDATCVSVWLGLPPVPDEYTHLLSHNPPVKTVEVFFDWDDSIHDLANRPYWSRYWVIQEFLLGKDVQLHCGNAQIDWTLFHELLCRNANIAPFGDEHITVLPDDKAASFAALPLTLGRHPDKHPEFLLPLYDLLVSHRRSVCKDPRDRVFALLGLVSVDERQLLSRFFPDYTMDENVVRLVVLAHLMQYGVLENPKLRNLTPDSEDIFLGLGVGSKLQRKRLLDQADRFAYFCDWRPGQLSQALAAGDILGLQMGADEYEVGETSVGTSVGETWMGDQSGSQGTNRTTLLGVAICLVLGVGFWWTVIRDGDIS